MMDKSTDLEREAWIASRLLVVGRAGVRACGRATNSVDHKYRLR